MSRESNRLRVLVAGSPELEQAFKNNPTVYAWFKQCLAERCTTEEALVGAIAGLAKDNQSQFEQLAEKGMAVLPAPVRPKHFDATHFKALTIGDRKFVYCPVGNIVSWHPEDYDHDYCAFCKRSFEEIRQS